MRVALDGYPLTERRTGVGHYTLELARALALIAPSDDSSWYLQLLLTTPRWRRLIMKASQYYGYLRRTSDTGGFNRRVSYLNAHPSDFRTMVNGFMNSIEYRQRFGP